LVGFYDADYAGDRIERKSNSGSCQFLKVRKTTRRGGGVELCVSKTSSLFRSRNVLRFRV